MTLETIEEKSMKKLSIVVLLLILIGCSAAEMSIIESLPTPDSRAPHIYFFSGLRNAFVVERADGTDSFLLGEGLVGGHDELGRVEWSPSGHYFSWMTYGQTGGAFILTWD